MTTMVADPARQSYVLARIAVEPNSGCWNWQLRRNWKGYGEASTKGRTAMAHRVSYESFVGAIPPGHQVDHLCRNRRCVNPAHLEAVTARENLARSTNAGATALRTGRCVHGHDLADAYVRKGGARECRACKAQRNRARSTPDAAVAR